MSVAVDRLAGAYPVESGRPRPDMPHQGPGVRGKQPHVSGSLPGMVRAASAILHEIQKFFPIHGPEVANGRFPHAEIARFSFPVNA